MGALRVAVVGGTGFVGRSVIAALAADGHDPYPIARHEPRIEPRGLRIADLLDLRSVVAALDGSDAVVSAAGSLRQSRGQSFHDVHVRGVRNLVEACRSRKIRRLVHLSSLGARASSRSAFHRTKHLGEDLASRSLLDVTVLRPSAIFGRADDFVLPLARMLARMPLALLPGRGAARLQPIAVEDVARAVATALARHDTVGQAYDLPGPEVLAIATIYDRVMEAIGRKRPKLSVPYLIIEPLSHLFGSSPVLHFTFDQLAILEESPLADPGPARPLVGAALTQLDVATIRALLRVSS